MPKTPKWTRKWNAATLKKAIEAVQTENISIRMVSAKFGIPKSAQYLSGTSNKGHSFETQHILYFRKVAFFRRLLCVECCP